MARKVAQDGLVVADPPRLQSRSSKWKQWRPNWQPICNYRNYICGCETLSKMSARWSRTPRGSHRLLKIFRPKGQALLVSVACATVAGWVSVANVRISTILHYYTARLWRQVSSSSCQSMELLGLWPNGIRKRFKLQLDTRWSAPLSQPSQPAILCGTLGSHAAASSDVFCLTRSP